MMRIAVFFAVFAVVFSFPLNDKRRRLQRIYSAVDPYTNNIFKDYIDVKIEAVTEKNLNRIFVKMDENTKEMLRMFEAMNIKIDNNAIKMNDKIDKTAAKLDSLDNELKAGKIAASILAAFLGVLVTTNLATFLKDVVQPFFTK